MASTAPELHARLTAAVNAAMSTTRRADNDAIQSALGDLASAGTLDEHTVAFLRQAHGLTLATTVALASVIDAHSGHSDIYGTIGCRVCGTLEDEPCRTLQRIADCLALYKMRRLPTIDASEAWRRANARLSTDRRSSQLLIAVDEFSDGYIARPVWLTLPRPPDVPSPDTVRVLIIDKLTGELTIWPLMTLAATTVQYRRYKDGEPMSFD